MKREDSTAYVPGAADEIEQVDLNPNTKLISDKNFWFFYLVLLFCVISILYFTGMNHSLIWTIVNVLHSIITFILMHWLKGSPIEGVLETQGKYDKLTFWEQIDEQNQFTPTRKVFFLIPITLFIITTFTVESTSVMILNLIATVVVIIPKLPFFHKIRLFGINRD
jgi:hypothetical protein